MTKRFFGTDGIRGKVGQYPITPDFILKLGWASGRVFARNAGTGGHALVIIGKDTRVSGYMFESALEAGLVSAGVDVKLMGPMPTITRLRSMRLLTRLLRFSAGLARAAYRRR